MASSSRLHNSVPLVSLRQQGATVTAIPMLLSSLLGLLLFMLVAQPAQCQAYTVIHSFTGGADGSNPQSGLTMDAAGNFYGTTTNGGSPSCQGGCGVIFQLSNSSSGWLFTPIYTFTARLGDGANPADARVILGPGGGLYGTTYGGGASPRWCYGGCGTVFKLSSPNWTETLLYDFRGGVDGRHPLSDVTFDNAGNAYGTTAGAGAYNSGTVYKLSPSPGGWTESVLYSFRGGTDGNYPFSGVTFDQSGNLYGVTLEGGGAFQNCSAGCGTVYQLLADEGWMKITLHTFTDESDGFGPGGDLVSDRAGNLYGINESGLPFMLTPSNGGWIFSEIYPPGVGPVAVGQGLSIDAAGDLYGTTAGGGAHGCGTVYKLTSGNGGWTYSSLHDFAGGSDGCSPVSTVLVDAAGNLYGTASKGGKYPNSHCSNGCGVAWKITP